MSLLINRLPWGAAKPECKGCQLLPFLCWGAKKTRNWRIYSLILYDPACTYHSKGILPETVSHFIALVNWPCQYESIRSVQFCSPPSLFPSWGLFHLIQKLNVHGAAPVGKQAAQGISSGRNAKPHWLGEFRHRQHRAHRSFLASLSFLCCKGTEMSSKQASEIEPESRSPPSPWRAEPGFEPRSKPNTYHSVGNVTVFSNHLTHTLRKTLHETERGKVIGASSENDLTLPGRAPWNNT